MTFVLKQGQRVKNYRFGDVNIVIKVLNISMNQTKGLVHKLVYYLLNYILFIWRL